MVYGPGGARRHGVIQTQICWAHCAGKEGRDALSGGELRLMAGDVVGMALVSEHPRAGAVANL
jgi:hypothetical protein